ncbi:uncharacterized protein LOC116392858 isoform X2 [Anarrhichthys ocellatus]|uniref:uncharacterized protein LOC116392858 isoform X2 n=1 Tax=Anarrhichthys ocellatus TaxID=433405 RepID=UPI0012ED35A8|nr:uncharacterized protein LOC116392858 isoform X2 [Anarrhichthys ocellatus]
MARVSIETSEAQHSVHVLEANGSRMSGAQQDGAMTADSLHLNGTAALGLLDLETNTALFEFKVFNIVIIALALCILTITGLYCITVCYNRTRKPEAARDNSRIYYIYSNPLPIGLKEEEDEWAAKAPRGPEGQSAVTLPLTFQEYANDPNSGVTLDPPIFYMQL